MDFGIYVPPECELCRDRGEEYLGSAKLCVCGRCKKKILVVNAATNQEYDKCINALRACNQVVMDAVNYLYNGGKRAMNSVAKFICNSVTKSKNWNANGPEYLYDAKFSAVTSGSEENKQFFGSTPSGEITIRSVRDDLYEPGAAYYVEFRKAE